MNLDMWKYIARDNHGDRDCWVFTDEPGLARDDGVWAGAKGMCGFAEDAGIPEEFWPAPGECRRITRFEIVFETEAVK